MCFSFSGKVQGKIIAVDIELLAEEAHQQRTEVCGQTPLHS